MRLFPRRQIDSTEQSRGSIRQCIQKEHAVSYDLPEMGAVNVGPVEM
jgi:hypothetical protein